MPWPPPHHASASNAPATSPHAATENASSSTAYGGVRKDELDIEAWVRDVAPGKKLRQWFGHDPDRWETFRQRYHEELDTREDAWLPLLQAARQGTITLVYGSKDTEHNNAVALRDYLTARMRRRKK